MIRQSTPSLAVLGGTDAIQETLSKSHDRDIIAKRGSFLEPDPIHSDMCVSGAGGTAQQEKHLTHQLKDVRLLPRAHVFRTEHSGDCVQSPPGHGETGRSLELAGKAASLAGRVKPAGEPVSAKWWFLRNGP